MFVFSLSPTPYAHKRQPLLLSYWIMLCHLKKHGKLFCPCIRSSIFLHSFELTSTRMEKICVCDARLCVFSFLLHFTLCPFCSARCVQTCSHVRQCICPLCSFSCPSFVSRFHLRQTLLRASRTTVFQAHLFLNSSERLTDRHHSGSCQTCNRVFPV